MGLHRYWFEFEISPGELGQYPSYAGLALGCGVTAHTLDDAFGILRQGIFKQDPLRCWIPAYRQMETFADSEEAAEREARARVEWLVDKEPS
jgi:hypothetical protein